MTRAGFLTGFLHGKLRLAVGLLVLAATGCLLPIGSNSAPDKTSASSNVTATSGLYKERLYNPPSEQDSLLYLQELRKRIRGDRYDLESRRKLASLLSVSPRIEDRREAAEALTHALKIDETDPDLWARLARLRRRQHYVGESQRAFGKALPTAGSLV